jgi:hypothetical protein
VHAVHRARDGVLLDAGALGGRSDVCTISGDFHRNRPGAEAVVGSFVSPYPQRFQFDDAATLDETVRRCHAAILTHREHKQVTPITSLGMSEWSRYNFNYLIDIGAEANDFGAVNVERLDWCAFEKRTAHDLGLFVRQGANGIRGVLAFNAERFSNELVTRAVARIGQFVRAITTTPTVRVHELPGAP